MTDQALTLFLETSTQQTVADFLGIRQSAVAQMVAAARDVRVVTDADGRITSIYELRKLPASRKRHGAQ